MNRHYTLALILLVFFLPGCADMAGDGLYQDPVTVEQNNQHLQSISSLLQAGKGNAAKQEADAINQVELTNAQQAQFNLSYAQIMLSFGEAEQALSKLSVIDSEQLSPNDKIKYHQSKAFAYSLTGNLLESAKARVALDALLGNVEERKRNQGIILETLGLVPEASAQGQPLNLPSWMALAKILSSRSKNPAGFNQSLANWKSANPEHPANLYLANIAGKPGLSGNTIAVLLPESGSYAEPARALKAGFMAAHSRYKGADKPPLKFYDTEKARAGDLYQQAINEGAKLVVGPLNKESIQQLVGSSTISAPVLALNHVANLSQQNLYQFALSPIDDATEITQKAMSDGFRKAVILVPNNDQGKRIGNYFIENWQSLGGDILKVQSYDPNKADLSGVLSAISGISIGQANPGYAVFLSAYAKEGRAINAQLSRYNGLRVYAMPNIYSGLPDPGNDSALNGVTFCDIPWLFIGAYNGDLSMMATRDTWHLFPASHIRLVAMGIDAFQLTTQFKALGTTPYPGATGNLSLESGNRIKRNLVCAKFVNGQPELIGFTHSPTEKDYSGTTLPATSP